MGAVCQNDPRRKESAACGGQPAAVRNHLLAFLAVGIYFKSSIVILIFGGMIFHLCLDLIRLKSWGAVSNRALSFVEYSARARKMRRQGMDPEAPFRKAYQDIASNPKP